MRQIPYEKLYCGETNISLSYDGSRIINKAYVGNALSLVRFSEYPRITLSVDSLRFITEGGSAEVTVRSNAGWTASTSASWLTITSGVSSGNGAFLVTASENDTEEDRDAVITVVCANADVSISSTIPVSQPYVTYTPMSFIYRDSAPTDNYTYAIVTPIYPAADCEMRVVYQTRGVSCDRIVGVTHADRQDGSDEKDFRLFNYSNGSLDVNNSRWSNLNITYGSGTDWDLTVGNAFVYNNLTSTYLTNNPQQTPLLASDTLIHIDVGANKVKSLEIKNGGVVVFNGVAAELNGEYGLFDLVSGTLCTNRDINITGDA